MPAASDATAVTTRCDAPRNLIAKPERRSTATASVMRAIPHGRGPPHRPAITNPLSTT